MRALVMTLPTWLRRGPRHVEEGSSPLVRPAPHDRPARIARLARVAGLRIFVVAALTYAFFFSGGDPNQATRFALTEALVMRHEPDITKVHFRTIDKGYKSQRFYADKAPGVSLLAVVPFEVMHLADRVFGIPGDAHDTRNAKLYFLSLLFSSLSGAGAALLLRRLAIFFGASARAAELTAFAYAFGTIAFPFSTVLFGHQFVALLLLGAFTLMVERRAAGTLSRPATLAAIGALWSTAIVSEYPTALLVASFGVGLLAWSLDRDRPAASVLRALAWTAAGGLPVLALHAAFLVWCYGKFALPYTYVSEPLFRAHMTGGILGISKPNLIATYGTLFSAYRGILFFCPVVALSVVGFGAWFTRTRGPERHPLYMILPGLGLYLLFAFSYYAWDGGGSFGPRHLLPALPYVMLPIAFFVDRSRWNLLLTGALATVSAVIMLLGTSVLVQLPQGDPFTMNPLYDLILPSALRGQGPINLQDAFIPFLRADASYNWGMLLGLSPRASLVMIPLLWFAAYAPSIVRASFPRKFQDVRA